MAVIDELLKEICEEKGKRIHILNLKYDEDINALMLHGLISKSSNGMSYYTYSPTQLGLQVNNDGGYIKWLASKTQEERLNQLREELYSMGINSLRDIRSGEKRNRYLALASAFGSLLSGAFAALAFLCRCH